MLLGVLQAKSPDAALWDVLEVCYMRVCVCVFMCVCVYVCVHVCVCVCMALWGVLEVCYTTDGIVLRPYCSPVKFLIYF
jgi:hypothetical protein